MYDELIKRLRDWPRVCAQYDGSVDQLHDESADAIEDLNKQIKNWEEALSKQNENWEEALKNALDFIPCWIPVAERLPDDRRDVQITVFWHDAWRTMYGYYDGAFWHLYAPMHTEVADVEVIGWMEKPDPMPLPQQSKEET